MKLLRAPFLLLTLLSVGVLALAFYIAGLTSYGARSSPIEISEEDRNLLTGFQQEFQQCVREQGMGLHGQPKDECNVRMVFSDESEAIWVRPSSVAERPKDWKSGGAGIRLQPVRDDYFVGTGSKLGTIVIVHTYQVRNSSTILTKEYIDALPNGWHDYAWKRINKGHSNTCSNITICKEKLALVLPTTPPYKQRQFNRCAVVGNSGDLLQELFGAEIDGFDAVIRMNGAPIQNYTQYVGKKTSFRILNRGSAKALDKVAALDATGKEVLIIKTTIHDIMTQMIRDVPIRNPVYLMVGMGLGVSAKGTGVKALEFALSVCEQVHIYGFTVDPGYLEWTRYFSEARKGHTPLQGRAYYQMMECLGLIAIHSPLRRPTSPNILHKSLSTGVINAAKRASKQALTLQQ